jgi:hypothetical protein
VIKVSKEELLSTLGYVDSPNYHLTTGEYHPLTAHLYRAANKAGVDGAYVFHTSPGDAVLPARPAVYIAEATTPEEAREIHRNLWNLGNAPFLIIILPGQIRVYTGFDYDQRNAERGLINVIDLLRGLDLGEALADYKADSIDSGRLWARQAQHLTPERRIDAHLLRNLRRLEEGLVNGGLDLPTAHSLIGKYVYIRYLKDRNILSPQWLEENEIDIDLVLGRNATLKGLRKLVEKLDERFNGHVFPFPLSGKKAPTSEQVAFAAAAFKGDDPGSGQLHLDFEPYNFSYIPVETLSSIYEQFLHAQGKGKKVGAVYTPEYLADYLIAELNHAKPLERGMKILDPCCGSGIFLVLAYRKLIELELNTRPDQKLRPSELRDILTKNIFGVERSRDACYVAELGLILTMLHYISPPDLHRNKQFQFPVLHNEQIFEADFFDEESQFWERTEKYDWIIGNPPWIEPEAGNEEEAYVLSWISDKKNRRERPVAGNRVAEAFSWRVIDLLSDEGCTGLILHATSLFNYESKKYRQEFFTRNEVVKVTNFSNLAYVLFGGRGEAPAATVIYRAARPNKEKGLIVHFGPFVINQALSESWKELGDRETWVLTINEDEISTIIPEEAESGESLTWKAALWGTHRDTKALQRLRKSFKTTLADLVKAKEWHFHQGVALRERPAPNKKNAYAVVHTPELEGRKYFDANAMNASQNRFHVPKEAFKRIPAERCYLRKRSGKSSLLKGRFAHLLLNTAYFVFTDEDFVLCAPHRRVSVPMKEADELRALSVFFSSSVARYYLFFQSAAWGIDRNQIYKSDIEQIPVPPLSASQIDRLATLQKEVASKEMEASSSGVFVDLQKRVDEEVEKVLNLPDSICTSAKDFLQVRLSLNKGKMEGVASQPPLPNDLLEYGRLLRDELDTFNKGRIHHKISFASSPTQELLICTVEVTNEAKPLEVSIDGGGNGHAGESLSWLSEKLRQQFSQWHYVQRSLRIFDGAKVYLCKGARLIDWTKTQALNDSDDLIAEVLSNRDVRQEVVANGA